MVSKLCKISICEAKLNLEGNINMPGKLLPYLLIFSLIFAIVGCTGIPAQSTGWHNYKGGSGSLAMATEVDSADNTETEEHVKQQIKDLKKESYLVDSNDVLDIVVFEEPDLSMTLWVSVKGTISYPLIGEVNIKGLTIYEVEKTLEERLRDGDYLKNPHITVKLDLALMKKYSEKEVFVMGEVENPGPIPILGKYITALEAVAKVGGFTEFAAPNRTIIVRVEDGVEKTITVDLNKVKKGDKSLDIILKQGDIVVVPETYF